MNLRNFYKKVISEAVGVPRNFDVCFPAKDFDASSNILIVSSVKNFEIISCLKNSGLFENFDKKDDLIRWDIPKKVWIHQLIIAHRFIMNFQSKICLPISVSEDELFRINYMYARIHSVLNHFRKNFPDVTEYESANLDLISRQDIVNLIKFMVGYPEWIMKAVETRDFSCLYGYLLKVRDSFDHLWISCDEKDAELCFILLNDLKQTKSRVFLLDVLRMILERSFAMVGITLKKEIS